jgi:hypothetical protein
VVAAVVMFSATLALLLYRYAALERDEIRANELAKEQAQVIKRLTEERAALEAKAAPPSEPVSAEEADDQEMDEAAGIDGGIDSEPRKVERW